MTEARPRRDLLLAALGYALLSLLLFGRSFQSDKLFVPMHTERLQPWRGELSPERSEQLQQGEQAGATDKLLFLIPDDQLTVDAYREGRLPLWNPNLAGGAPHLAQSAYGVFYPLHQLFRWVELERAYGFLICVLHFLAALFTYLYVRRIGAGPPGAFLAGLAFSFSFCLIYRAHYYQYIEAFAWMPLGLYLVERWFDRRSLTTLACLALLTACVMLTGWPQASIYAISTWVILTLYRSGAEDLALRAPKLAGAFLLVLAAGTATDMFLDEAGHGILLACGPWVALLICFLVSSGKRAFLVRTSWVGAALMLGGLVAAIQYLPAMEWAPFANRSGFVTPGLQAEFGLRPWFLLSGLSPYLFGEPGFAFQDSLYHLTRIMALSQGLLSDSQALFNNLKHAENFGNLLENSFYFGLLPCLLVPAGILMRSPRRGYLSLLLLLFAGTCVGVTFILYPLYYGGFAVGKDVRRTLVVIVFAACCLFGLAVSAVGQGRGRKSMRVLAVACSVAALLALVCGLLLSDGTLAAPLLRRAEAVGRAIGESGQLPADAIAAATELVRGCLIRFGWTGLLSGLALLLLTSGLRPGLRFGSVIGVVLIDLLSLAWPLTAPIQRDGFLGTHPLIEHLSKTTGRSGRLARYNSESQSLVYGTALPPNLPTAYGLLDAWCYSVFPPRRFMLLAERIDPDWNLEGQIFLEPLTRPEQLASRALDLMAVQSIIGIGEPPTELPEGIVDDGRYDSAFALRNERALPRVFCVADHELADAGDEQGSLNRLLSNYFDPLQKVLLEADDPPDRVPGDPTRLPKAELSDEQPERLSVSLQGGTSPGFLVILDSYAPGWQARVDGTPAQVYLADFAFRAVPFPAGAREIVLEYQPESVRRGAVISLSALLIILIALVIGLVRKRPEQPNPA